MIIHIPHSSRAVPEKYAGQFVLSREEFGREMLLMTDAFTDELFESPDGECRVFPVSRLVVDPERFPGDEEEPMSRRGMGVIYTKTSRGLPLRRPLSGGERAELLDSFYWPHQRALSEAVNREIEERGAALLVDAHSFPSSPLPCDVDQNPRRPDFCIGSDRFHTPPMLIRRIEKRLSERGYSVTVNRPYSGSFVPAEFHGKDPRVSSVMIEVNRGLYMVEETGLRAERFPVIRQVVLDLLEDIKKSLN